MTNNNKIHVDDFLKSGFADSGKNPGAHVWEKIGLQIARRNKKRQIILFAVLAFYLGCLAWLQSTCSASLIPSVSFVNTKNAPTVITKQASVSTTPLPQSNLKNQLIPDNTIQNSSSANSSNPNKIVSTDYISDQTKSNLPSIKIPDLPSEEKQLQEDSTNPHTSKGSKTKNPENNNSELTIPAVLQATDSKNKSSDYAAEPGMNLKYFFNPMNLNEYRDYKSAVQINKNKPSLNLRNNYFHTKHRTGLFVEAGFDLIKPDIRWEINNNNKKFAHKDLKNPNNNNIKNRTIIIPEIKLGYNLGRFNISTGYMNYKFDYSKNFYLKSISRPFVVDVNYGILAYKEELDTPSGMRTYYEVDDTIKNSYSYSKIPLEITYGFNLGNNFNLNMGIGSALQFSKIAENSNLYKYNYYVYTSDSVRQTMGSPKVNTDFRILMSLGYRFPKSNTSAVFNFRLTQNLRPEELISYGLLSSRIRTYEIGLKLKYDF